MTEYTAPSHSGTALAGGLYALSLALLAADTGLYRLVGVATLAGVLLGGASVLGPRETPLSTGVSSLLFVGAGVGLLAAGGVASQVPPGQFRPAQSPAQLRPVVLLLAVFCTAVGATVLSRGEASRAIARSLATTGGVLTVLLGAVLGVVLTAVPLVGWIVGPLFERVFLPSQSPENPGSLVVLLGGASIAIGALAVRLPIPELVTRDNRSRAAARLERVSRYTFTFGIAAVIIGTVVFLGLPSTWDLVPESVAGTLLLVSTAAPFRYALLGLASGAGCCVALVEGLRRVQPESLQDVLALLAQSLGALVVLAGVTAVGFDSIVGTVLEVLGDDSAVAGLSTEFGNVALVVGAVFLGCVSLLALVGAGGLFGYLGVLSARTAGAVVATSGVVVAAIAAGQIAGVSVLLFVVVAAALVAWDVATYSHRLVTEVDRGSRTLELLHFGAVTFVALLGVAVVYGGLLVTETVAPRRSPAAAIAALVSILLILSTLRT